VSVVFFDCVLLNWFHTSIQSKCNSMKFIFSNKILFDFGNPWVRL
jgi:hypothetical protein